jgi:hypothetical protein
MNREIMKKVLYLGIGISLAFMQRTPSVYSQTTLPSLGDNICMKDGTKCSLADIPQMIHLIASYLVGIAGTISVIMVMWGGYQWIMGGVSEDQKSKAKKTLFYAIIGLIITLLSWVIVNVIQINITS